MAKYKSVASFPVEFFDMWTLALQEKLVVDFLDAKGHRTAVNKRMQMHQFRKKLLEEDPARAAPFYQVDLRVEELPNGAGRLVAFIPDWKKQVREAVQKEHLVPTKPTELLQQVKAEADKASEGRLDETLQRFGFKGEGIG